MTDADNAALLASSRLFAGIDGKGLGYLADRSVRRTFQHGETIFREGDAGDSLYVIASGIVKVWVSSGEGSEMVLATLRSPDAFGELSAVDGEGRSASATALEATELVSLDRATLLDAVHHHPGVADGMMRGLGGLARRITEQASDLVFLDLTGRLAKTLSTLAERDGRVDGDTIVLALPLTQSELAEMVGGSRQSVNHILKTFEARGFISVSGRDVLILDPEALRRRGAR
ncbi:MAG: Crp/Fnr family transcriptional regulator [Actinomycetota bacterium]|nr:Crp/Fnr family transcriptional regulator [Actinomycetota bacterium]